MKRKLLLAAGLTLLNAASIYTLATPLHAQPPEITCANTDCDGARACEYKEHYKCGIASGGTGCGVSLC